MRKIVILYIILKYYYYCFKFRGIKDKKWYSLEYKITGYDHIWVEKYPYVHVLMHRLSFFIKRIDYFIIKEMYAKK